MGGYTQISDRVMCRQVQQECLPLTQQPYGPTASVKMWSGSDRIKPSRSRDPKQSAGSIQFVTPRTESP